MTAAAATFSVVVAAWSGPPALARCLAALLPQLRDGDEVVVAQNFPGGGVAGEVADGLRTAPRVTVIRCADDTNVPRLRSAGLATSRGAVVAFLEDHAEPLAGWRDAIVAAFAARAPNSPIAAVGGPIAPPPPGAAIDDAVWFYDYASFAPPRDSAAVASLSGANVAYDRAALLDALAADPLAADPLAAGDGVHEASVQRLLLARGRALLLAGDAVVRVGRHERPIRALRLAFDLARGFAARRAAAAGAADRVFRVLTSPLVPFVLFARCAGHAWRVPMLRSRFLRAAGWLLLLQGAWGLGEGIGGCFGAGGADARWR